MLILLFLFTLLAGFDALDPFVDARKVIIFCKILSTVGILWILSTILLGMGTGDIERKALKKSNDTFEVKSITYLLASPDEIANALTDVKLR